MNFECNSTGSKVKMHVFSAESQMGSTLMRVVESARTIKGAKEVSAILNNI